MTTEIQAANFSTYTQASEITDAHFQTVLVGKYVFQDEITVESDETPGETIIIPDIVDRVIQGSDLDEALDYLGVTSVRFPGGTEAWNGDFDYTDPSNIAELHAVIDYCASQGIGLQYTVPVRWFLSDGEEGLREGVMTTQEKADLQNFIINDLLGYAAGAGVVVENIKLGNEPLSGRSAGLGMKMNEYGDAAGLVAAAVGEALAVFESDNSFSAYTSSNAYSSPDVVLELPGWNDGIDQIIDNFDTGAVQYVTAVDAHGTHLTLGATYDELLGTDADENDWHDDISVADSLTLLLGYWDQAWSDKGGDPLTYLNEAWTVDQTGLQGLGRAVLTFHSMSLAGLESATYWTASGYGKGGYASPSSLYVEVPDRVQPVGVLFQQMGTHLKGMSAIELGQGTANADEINQDTFTRAFYDDGRLVLYVVNTTGATQDLDIGLATLLPSIPGFSGDGTFADVEVVKIGAVNGNIDEYGRGDFDIYGDETVGLDSTIDGISLEAYETVQISITASGEFGTDAADNIVSGDGEDWVFGYDGDDTISTGNGNDRIDAGAGDDIIYGGDQYDTINAGDGNDVVDGGKGWDYIEAGAGDDVVDGGNGSDTVYLGDGNDIFHDDDQQGDNAQDTVYGGNGDDTVNGGGGNDVFSGDFGNDYIQGGEGHDTLHGGLGNDTLHGGNGQDKIYGGEGADTIHGGSGWDDIEAGAGDDVVEGGNGRDTVYLGDGNDIFHDNDQQGNNAHDTVYGGNGNDTVNGGGGNDVFSGGAGNDMIFGGAGNDMIFGGSGWDDIEAGAGDDVVEGGNGRDTVYLGDGNDIFHDNDQQGNNAHDTVYGGNGDDTIHIGGGNNVVTGGDGNDVFVFSDSSSGSHTITDFTRGDDHIDLSDVSSVSNWTDLQNTHLTATGIDVGGGSVITLTGMDTSTLTVDDFVFV